MEVTYTFVIVMVGVFLIFMLWGLIGLKNPRYDLLEKKIKDCKKDSYCWFHEYRHSIQHKKDVLSIFVMATRFIFLIVGCFYIITKGIDIYGLTLLLPVVFIGYLEIDAHIYAIKNYGKRRTKDAK